MKEYKVGIIGGTGMVGQRFITLMENHPWFRLTVIAASARSAGKTYGEAAEKRWVMPTPIPAGGCSSACSASIWGCSAWGTVWTSSGWPWRRRLSSAIWPGPWPC